MRPAKLLALAAFAALPVLAPAAAAQPRDPTGAEALFWEGRRAFDGGQYDVACARFEESQRLDPSVGTLFNLAVCEEARGTIAQAWQHFAQAEGQLPPKDDRRTYAAEHVAALGARLPRLTVALPPSPPAGLAVSRDGIAVAPSGFGSPLPTAPGRHAIVISVPGRPDRTLEIELAERESKTVIAEPSAAPTAPVAWTPPPARPAPDRASPWRTVGWASIGLGAAGIALGAVAGLIALEKNATIEDCEKGTDGRFKCGSDGVDAATSGRTWATTSTIAFIAGGAAVAGGVTLVRTTSPAASSKTGGPSVRLGVGRSF